MKKAITLAALTAMTGTSFAALSVVPTTLYEFTSGSTTTDSMGTQDLAGAGTTTASGMFGDAVDASSTATKFVGATSSTNANDASNASWHTEPGTTDWATSFWFNPGDAAPTTKGFLMPVSQGARWGGGPSQTAGWNFEAKDTGLIAFNFGTNSGRTTIAGSSMILSAWNHIAVSRSGNIMSYYVNGALAGTADSTGQDIAVDNAGGEYYRQLYIGNGLSGSGGTLRAGAAVDDLAFWNGSAITAGDVAQIWNDGTGASIASLVISAPAGYNSWATTNGVPGQAANFDHDNDGVSNGVEYFIDGPTGNTTGFTPLPSVTTTAGVRSITWTKAATYAGTYGTGFVVETSTTLAGAWTVETLGIDVNVSGDNVTYTFPAGPVKNFARLKVTGP